MVKVKPTANQGRITVKTSNDTTVFGVKDNLSEYYAKLAERWANSPDMVNGMDYSSKYYAEQAQLNAEKTQIAKDEVLASIEGLDVLTEEAKNNIAETSKIAVDNISHISTEVSAIIQANIDENCKSLPMLTPVWTDHIYNDASYLRADTFSWHYASVYTTGYDNIEREFLDELATVEIENGVVYKLSPNGFKIADVSQCEVISNLYASNQKAWFYIIDTENRRFKLPREKSASHKYLYFFVGNYVRPDSEIVINNITKSLNDKIDLDGGNFSSSGLENIITNSIGKKVLQSQTSNSLLEVPQRIKFELADGVLTLKAGSEVIVPNGFEADGVTPKFDYVIIESDINTTNQDATTIVFYIAYSSTSPQLYNAFIGSCASGSGKGNGLYYSTDENKMFVNGIDIQASLPIAIATSNTTAITSINQVFNGTGYIGSTVWIDKGVKGLIPNGRNEDGSLKNIEFITSKVAIENYDNNITSDVNHYLVAETNTDADLVGGSIFWSLSTEYIISSIQPPTRDFTLWYDTENNLHKRCINSEWHIAKVVRITREVIINDKVSNFRPRQPFRAVDYSQVDGQWIFGRVTLASDVVWNSSLPTVDYDLSDFLPKDGYNYEVLFASVGYTGSVSGNFISLTFQTDMMPNVIVFGQARTRTASSVDCGGCCVLPVGSGRKISKGTSSSSNANGTYTLYAYGYRRIGSI